jgi:hypothetical protein
MPPCYAAAWTPPRGTLGPTTAHSREGWMSQGKLVRDRIWSIYRSGAIGSACRAGIRLADGRNG